jgi:DNA-binding NarL/FixJ family response regulator
MRPSRSISDEVTVGALEAEKEYADMSTSASTQKALRVVVMATGRGSSRVRHALAADGLEVIGAARTSAELERRASDADAVVVQLRDREPAAHVAERRGVAPDLRIVALTGAALSVRQLRSLLGAGADAVVLDGDASGALGPAVRAACAGQLSIPGTLQHAFVKPVLSTREKQVLGLVVLGLTNSEIARKLHLAESTVKSHLSSSFAKLGARSRSEATALILDPATGLGTGILTIADEG